MSSLDYLDWVRGKGCCVCGQPGEPHHLKAVGMGRNRKRPMAEHYTVVPLCRVHHTQIHQEGQSSLGLDVWKVSALLVAEYFWNNDK